MSARSRLTTTTTDVETRRDERATNERSETNDVNERR